MVKQAYSITRQWQHYTNSINIGSLTSSIPVTLNNSVTTSGDQVYENNLTLASTPITLTAVNISLDASQEIITA